MFPAVIAIQCAHWRGNPHPRRERFELKRYKYTAFKDTDCHTSDIGHSRAWNVARFSRVRMFAMTKVGRFL